MKKIFKFFMTVFVFATCLGFNTSCNDHSDEEQKDLASQIEGTYIGTGKLVDTDFVGLEYQSYPGMKMMVTRSSNEYVVITPYKADGKPFFQSASGDVFMVTKTSSGDFILTSSTLPYSRVSISKSGSLDYYYPYVTVGETTGYALSFLGNRER